MFPLVGLAITWLKNYLWSLPDCLQFSMLLSTNTSASAFEGKRLLVLGHLKFVFPNLKQVACEIGITVDSLNYLPKAK